MAASITPTMVDPISISTFSLRSILSYQTLIQHFQTHLPSLSPTTFHSPHRQSFSLSSPPSSSLLLLMPSWSSFPSLPYIGVKLVTYFPNNSTVNLPGVNGSYVLFSAVTGQTLASMDGTELTLWRTACLSGVASNLLSPVNARVLVMVGAGNLAPHLIKAHMTVRPSINKVIIWNRKVEKARVLAEILKTEECFDEVVFESSEFLDEIVGLADIISCATNSETALVKGEKLKKGVHLDLVGSFTPSMKECDDEAIRRGRVFIDNEGALIESGELVGAFERKVISKEEICGNLVELIKGEAVGRKNKEEITVFKSVGSAAVDILAAQLAYETVSRHPMDPLESGLAPSLSHSV